MSPTGLLEAPETTDLAGSSEPAAAPPQRIRPTEVVLSLLAGTLFAWYVLGPIEGPAAVDIAPPDGQPTESAADAKPAAQQKTASR